MHEHAARPAPGRDRIARPRHWRLTGFIGLGLLVAALVVPVTASAASTPNEASCAGHWPSSVQGKPTSFTSGARAGDYIWHDSTGWHLRVTHASSSRFVFTGRITSSAALHVTPFHLESGDWVRLSADKRTITYSFKNYGHIDGLDFTTACARRVTFGGSLAGMKLPIARIWIGHNNHHPLQNPFSVYRVS